MKALIIGATGATGKDLVNALLQDAFYTEVVIFVRRSCGLTRDCERETGWRHFHNYPLLHNILSALLEQ